MDKKSIFRKKSLDTLAAPEKLDDVIRVTSPKGWIALLTLLGTIALFIVWAVYDSIPSTIPGTCMLIKTGGVINITSSITGRLSDIAVVRGDRIRRGQTIARIEEPELVNKIFLARSQLKALQVKTKRQQAYYNKKREHLAKAINNYREQLANKKTLLKEGLITKQNVLSAEQKIKEAQNKLTKIELDIPLEQQVVDRAERGLTTLRREHELGHRITTPYSGQVIEVLVSPPDFIKPGEPLITMEQTGKHIRELEVVIYVPASKGKIIRPGMAVNIAPSTVSSAEYGTMIGHVAKVATYPATFQTMMKIIGNKQLVQRILQKGTPIEVIAYLIPDKNTASGYRWTSRKGPNTLIQSGTLCTGKITTKQQRPINLVAPWIKQLFK